MAGEVKQIEIKNRNYYFYNDIFNLKNLESNFLKIDKNHYKNIDIYYIGYIAVKKKWWLWKHLQCKSFVFDYGNGK